MMVLCFVPMAIRAQVVVQMEKVGGVFEVPCKINDVPMKFIFDTGASLVCMSMSEAVFMIKNGYISQSDIIGTTYSQIANGDVVKGAKIVIRKLEIGGLVLENVEANIDPSFNAPLLLGQSAIQKLGSIQLDGDKLIINSAVSGNAMKQALYYFQQGLYAMDEHKTSEAIENYRKSISIQPLPNAYVNLASVYTDLGELDQSLSILKDAFAKFPYNVALSYNLGNIYFLKDDYTTALKYFNISETILKEKQGKIGDSEKDALISNYIRMGQAYSYNHEYINAKGAFQKAIYLAPNDSKPILMLGNLYERIDSIDQAIACYERGLSLTASSMRAMSDYYSLACCYEKKDMKNKAIESLKNCIEIRKKYNENFTYVTKASLGLDGKHYSKADMLEITGEAQSYFYAELMLGELLFDNNNAEGVSHLVNVMDYGPLKGTKEIPWFDYSACIQYYQEINDTVKAYEKLDQGLATYPNHPELLYRKLVLMGSQKTEQKIPIYDQILSMESSYRPYTFNYATIYNGKALDCGKLGRLEEALTNAERAVQLGPNFDYCWRTLGVTYFANGKYKECISAMKQCLKISNTYSDIANKLITLSKEKL
jgi:clan AA aspartic protease (TIGR02281 family)